MARTFNGNTANRLVSSNVPLSAYPYSIFVRIKPTDSAANKYVWTMTSGNDSLKSIRLRVSATGDLVQYDAVDNVNPQIVVTSLAAISFGVWNSIVCVSASSASHKLYVNGVLQNTSTNTATFPAGMDRLGVGYAYSGAGYTPAAPFLGDIADLAITTTAVTDQNVTDYHASNLSPACVATLIDYWKLGASPASGLENSVSGGHGDLTQAGTTASATDPTIYYEMLSIAATDAVKAEGTP